MTQPDTIPVRYSEDEAGYVSFRPVVRQTFSFHELLDMILSVTGKDAVRVRQILRAGTISFRSYRYWWTGFEPSEAEVRDALAGFPDADPKRAFSAENCTLIVLESGGVAAREIAEIDRKAGAAQGWFKRGSLWDVLMAAALGATPAYDGYSYARRADVYACSVTPETAAELAAQAERVAPRAMRHTARLFPEARRLLMVCPRSTVENP